MKKVSKARLSSRTIVACPLNTEEIVRDRDVRLNLAPATGQSNHHASRCCLRRLPSFLH
jgi:hypothetical protein